MNAQRHGVGATGNAGFGFTSAAAGSGDPPRVAPYERIAVGVQPCVVSQVITAGEVEVVYEGIFHPVADGAVWHGNGWRFKGVGYAAACADSAGLAPFVREIRRRSLS